MTVETTKALGLTIPEVAFAADEIIEWPCSTNAATS
jgi:hypothetical protein